MSSDLSCFVNVFQGKSGAIKIKGIEPSEAMAYHGNVKKKMLGR